MANFNKLDNSEKIKKLVNRAKNGDKEAYTTLMMHFRKFLFHVAKSKLNNIEDINDVIQDAILISYKNLRKLKDPENFKPWILRILINECNKLYKKQYKEKDLYDKMVDSYKNPEYDIGNIESTESKIDMYNAIKDLKYEDKLCINLFYGDYYSVDEIAEILNISSSAVRNKIYRCKRDIKNNYYGGVKYEETN